MMMRLKKLIKPEPIALSDDDDDAAVTCNASPPAKRYRTVATPLSRDVPMSPRSDGSEASQCGDFVFEDDDDCEDFIPKGALRGVIAAAAVLRPEDAASLASMKPRASPGALRALLPIGGMSAPQEVALGGLSLTPAQTQAVQLVAREARPKSSAAEKALDKRLQQWGYKPGQLSEVLAYIKNEAPIIIHIDLAAKVELLQKDTHYRNQFETRSTRGSNDLAKRKSWEDRLFPGVYNDAKPFDRVKYGVLNAVNDPRGIATVAKQYGQDYLVLRGVRLRTTFSDKDSCNMGQLASCEWYAHVLGQYNDLELRAVAEVALGQRLFADSAVLETAAGGYKEVQIHGELQLASHVESVVVHPSRLGTPSEIVIREWCKSLGIQFQCMSCLQGGSSSSGAGASANATELPATGECFAGAPVWRWGLPEHVDTWLRFDTFASATLELRHRLGGTTGAMPTIPVGSVVSLNTTSMSMLVGVDGEEAKIVLHRCKPLAASSSAGRVSAGAETAVPSTPAPRAAELFPTVWEWCASACGKGSWITYDAEPSLKLEKAFKRHSHEVQLTLGSTQYRIDLKGMMQINCRTNFGRMVRRR